MSDSRLKPINVKEAAKTAKVWGAFKPHDRSNKITKSSKNQSTKPLGRKKDQNTKYLKLTSKDEMFSDKGKFPGSKPFRKPKPMKRNKIRSRVKDGKKSVQCNNDDLFENFYSEQSDRPVPKPRHSLANKKENSVLGRKPHPKPRNLLKGSKPSKNPSEVTFNDLKGTSTPKSFLQAKGSQFVKTIRNLMPLKSSTRPRTKSESASGIAGSTKNKKVPDAKPSRLRKSFIRRKKKLHEVVETQNAPEVLPRTIYADWAWRMSTGRNKKGRPVADKRHRFSYED